MMIVQIEGPLADIRPLTQVPGVRLQSGLHPRGGDRYMVYAVISRDEAVAEIEARGLTVRVTMGKDEVSRRATEERKTMKDALPDAGTPPSEPGSPNNDGDDGDGAP